MKRRNRKPLFCRACGKVIPGTRRERYCGPDCRLGTLLLKSAEVSGDANRTNAALSYSPLNQTARRPIST